MMTKINAEAEQAVIASLMTDEDQRYLITSIPEGWFAAPITHDAFMSIRTRYFDQQPRIQPLPDA